MITLESIFESWDGCMYDGIDVGQALRADFSKIAAAPQVVADEPMAWLVFAEDHNGMIPQHPPSATRLEATRYASMFGQTPTEVRPLYERAAAPVHAQHSDDIAVDRCAVAMKDKLAASRAKGRGGWDDPAQCSIASLSALLRVHVEKSDPLDVANIAMMIQQRGGSIAPVQAQEPVDWQKIALFYQDLYSQEKHRAPVQPVAVPDGEFLSWVLKDRINMWESYIANVTRMKASGFPIGGTDEDDCMLKVERAKNLLTHIAAPAAQGDAKELTAALQGIYHSDFQDNSNGYDLAIARAAIAAKEAS